MFLFNKYSLYFVCNPTQLETSLLRQIVSFHHFTILSLQNPQTIPY